jgi:hypothetical protein
VRSRLQRNTMSPGQKPPSLTGKSVVVAVPVCWLYPFPQRLWRCYRLLSDLWILPFLILPVPLPIAIAFMTAASVRMVPSSTLPPFASLCKGHDGAITMLQVQGIILVRKLATTHSKSYNFTVHKTQEPTICALHHEPGMLPDKKKLFS